MSQGGEDWGEFWFGVFCMALIVAAGIILWNVT